MKINNKLKVMYLTSTLNRDNGMGNFSFQLITALQKTINAKVMVSMKEPAVSIDTHPILPDPMKSSAVDLIAGSVRLSKQAKQCDIIHCLDEHYLALTGLTAFLAKKPYVIHSIGTYSALLLRKTVLKALYKFIFKRAHRVICISRFTRDVLMKHITLHNTEVIFPGVSEEYFVQSEDIVPVGKKENIILLSVGAVKGRKGYDISLRAFAKVKKKINSIKYYITGDIQSGQYYELLKQIIKEQGIENDVAFLGKVNRTELITLYQDCTIFVLTPRYINDNFEGFGLVYLEAGASAKPVVASASGGVPDAVVDRETGILVPENDCDATAAALEELINNEELRHTLGTNGYHRARKFTWDTSASQIMRIYETCQPS